MIPQICKLKKKKKRLQSSMCKLVFIFKDIGGKENERARGYTLSTYHVGKCQEDNIKS